MNINKHRYNTTISTMEETFKKLENKIEELSEKLEESNKRIAELEEYFSCELCGYKDSVHVCRFCSRKTCKYCRIKWENKDMHRKGIEKIKFVCKWCNDCVFK